MKFWQRRRERLERRETERWASLIHPPITVAERGAALERKGIEDAKHMFIDMGDGQGAIRFATGVIYYPDLRLIHGYAAVLVGYDRWGWPVGSLESPAAIEGGRE